MNSYDVLDCAKSGSVYGGASFSIRNRVVRALWIAVWRLFASWTPSKWWRWRIFLLRLFGANVANACDVKGSARVWLPSNLTLGKYAQIGDNATCYNQAPIVIEEHALISQGAHLCAGTHDIDTASFQLVASPIVIRCRAWIAAEAFVGPGVTVGEGAVLGARGVCFKDLEDWTVYIGNPCKPVRLRNSKWAGKAS
jgi:putative colanic acid biosynthesis acetyltransferase WcaF